MKVMKSNERTVSINADTEEHVLDKLTKPVLYLTFYSALGGFLFGYDTGIVSGAMLLIRNDFELSTVWHELIVSVTIVAAWASSLVGGTTADCFGRKKVILFSSVVFVVGSVVLGFAQNKEMLLVGRIVVGIGIGFSSMCIPVYISELAPSTLRGRLTVINTIFITGGQFVASVTCGLLFGFSNGWRWMLGLGALPAVLQFSAFTYAPESPRWLSMNGRLEEAEEVLLEFRSSDSDIASELASLANAKGQTSGIMAVISSRPVRRALILGCLLQLFQQISGINTVMYYSASIISLAGFNNDGTAIWLAAATSFCNFSFTFVGFWLVERVGRRPLTLGSLLGVAVALFSLALSFQITYVNSPPVTNLTEEVNRCSQFTYCSSCTDAPECGFCFAESSGVIQTSFCLPSNLSAFNEVSTSGLCASLEDSEAIFAYDYCPTNFAWLSIVGLCLYLCFFAPGMGPMPWSINSEIYPSWARAKCTSIATSVNWGANLIVSLTFLSLTEAITTHGAFYLYMCLAMAGFWVFFFTLPETKGVRLEEVESLFEKSLCSLAPCKSRGADQQSASTDLNVT